MTKQGLGIKGFGQVDNIQYIVSRFIACLEVDSGSTTFHFGSFDPLNLIEPLLTGFGRPNRLFPVKLAVFLNNGFLPPDLILLGLIGLKPDFVGFLVKLKIAGIGGVIGQHFTFQHEIGVICHSIEKITVMRNDQKRTFVTLEKFFQPFGGCQIQMIGWLIHQNDGRFT
ncbi:hypothetical protein SDC9_117631 [bioreactor metagenome]|uniref:Uncharacterized protein n=1 Tax=bioreactor metagenome TaxID=1076179 RepID=A0A645BZI7_9ZZZZ